jgi:hypothetical protein
VDLVHAPAAAATAAGSVVDNPNHSMQMQHMLPGYAPHCREQDTTPSTSRGAGHASAPFPWRTGNLPRLFTDNYGYKATAQHMM